ncbi:hypothetical protein [Salinimicrobium oceani]|uniref:Uncharacterized protein n=1 Tax=Salinimicrobium oceani TaxID=2722702 RepID=A0ABX1CZ82_9FLAO|nr:hypothetical protein [Salinimicrobium oceani]NJW51626.1 hypothetical protein [Salinimicrobium oceani]
MKAVYTLLLILFLSSAATAQENYLDTIAQKACDCIETQKLIEQYEGEQLTMQMGVCLMTASGAYREQLMKDHDINFDRLDLEGEKLGILIGSRMAFICPNFIISAAGDGSDEEVANFSATGVITSISEKPFVVFTIKNDQGRTTDFFWLTFIASEFDLQHDFKKLVGKKVDVTYVEEELFDPRINDYRYFNHLVTLELAE